MRIDNHFFNSFMTEPLLGFGCAVLLSTKTSPLYQANAPGLIRTAGTLMFPIGLVMIALTSADLFTSNIMFMTTAFLHRRISLRDVNISWTISYIGDLTRMLFFIAIIIGYGGVLSDILAYKQETVNFGIQKALDPGWHRIFIRVIGANWLVCMTVFLSISAREIRSKIIAIWFPTATFVALALDHVIANMFFISIGIWNGVPFGVGYYIWKSLIPTTLGNMVGSGLFVGGVYWYFYLTGEGSVDIDFNMSALGSGYISARESENFEILCFPWTNLRTDVEYLKTNNSFSFLQY
ncbi:Formate/nitrite transporter-domain-containing protein [Halenospora varia]|nr:Formate/nitrite transporter-domain-containing protein [Halenospora varia]